MKRNSRLLLPGSWETAAPTPADILQHEPEILEPTLRVFYQWYTGPSTQLKGHPSLATMYAYASYLVDTFGGQSYLLRRDSRTRLADDVLLHPGAGPGQRPEAQPSR